MIGKNAATRVLLLGGGICSWGGGVASPYAHHLRGVLRIPTWNTVPGTGILANILAMLSEIGDVG